MKTAAAAAKILADMELEATVFAQKCSSARKKLEKVDRPSPASRKGPGTLPKNEVINITGRLRKNVARKTK